MFFEEVRHMVKTGILNTSTSEKGEEYGASTHFSY